MSISIASSPRTGARYLYVGTATLIALIVYLAFTRTFWTPLAEGSLALHPAVVVHAVLFFLWTLFFVTQSWLPIAGRTALHRELGLFGIALAAVMVFSGILATIVTLQSGLAGPRPEAARASAVLGIPAMALFTTFIALGIANVRKPDWHKRLMMLATFSILQAAVARVIRLFPLITLPQRMVIGAVIVDALLLVVVLLDARVRGRVHPVYAAGGALIVLVQYGRGELLATDVWVSFCDWLAALGG
jgi:hypothetical protein